MENKAFRNKLISLVLPITLQNFMVALIPISDAVMLVFLGQDQMSAVSMAAQVAFVFNLFIYGLTLGASMFIAQYWGKGDIDSIDRLYGYCMKILIPIAGVFCLAALFLGNGIMSIYSSEPAIIEYGIPYLRIAAFSYVFTGVTMLLDTILKNTGVVKECTVISIAGVVLNIILNALFIYGLLGIPQMGCRGAALATTISTFVEFIASIIVIKRKGKTHLRLKYIAKTDLSMRREFSNYSTPLFANQLLWGIGFTMISVIIGHLGSDATAANSIVAVVKDLVSCFCYALGSGGAIMVGNELGAGNLDVAKQYGSKFCKLTIVSGLIAGALIGAVSPLIVKFANLTPTASHYLQAMLLMCIYYMVGRSINSTLIGGIFAAGGDTKFGFICDTITMWAFIVPVGMLAAFVIKLPVLWVYFILNLDEMIKLPAVYFHYKKYKWVRNIVS